MVHRVKDWRSETIVAVRRHLRIWVWLDALAILAVISRGAACANDGDPHLLSLSDYLAGGVLEDPLLGLTLREDRRDLKSGASATGLLIIDIKKRSPAANAGLAALRTSPKEILSGIVVVGSMAFPPAILLLLITNSLPNELGGDLIIAADGLRVRNRLDYRNGIRDVRPGEIVYLTVVHSGMRKQVAVPIPAREN
jgi:S1-C subfamily serine protease